MVHVCAFQGEINRSNKNNLYRQLPTSLRVIGDMTDSETVHNAV